MYTNQKTDHSSQVYKDLRVLYANFHSMTEEWKHSLCVFFEDDAEARTKFDNAIKNHSDWVPLRAPIEDLSRAMVYLGVAPLPVHKNSEQDEKSAWNLYIRRQVYHHLIDIAFCGETTTYEAIALHFGLPNAGSALGATLSPILGSIFTFCQETKQPHLTALVVRKSGADQFLPGAGFWMMLGKTDLTRDQKRETTVKLQRAVFDFYGKLA